MSIDELCALPVKRLAEKDCLLFLWATFPQLPEALQLIKAWGFQFKTVAFVWLKRNKKSLHGFTGWATGRGAMRKSACLPNAASPNATAPVSTSSLSPRWRNTAKSRT